MHRQRLDVPKRKLGPDMELDRQADDFRTCFQLTEAGLLGYARRLRSHPAPSNRFYLEMPALASSGRSMNLTIQPLLKTR